MVSRRAFTLIELLVVMAIIGILAAIHFPVFARDDARMVSPAETILFCESGITDPGHNQDDYDAWNGLSSVEPLFNTSRHNGGTNSSFVDGHAAWRKYERGRFAATGVVVGLCTVCGGAAPASSRRPAYASLTGGIGRAGVMSKS